MSVPIVIPLTQQKDISIQASLSIHAYYLKVIPMLLYEPSHHPHTEVLTCHFAVSMKNNAISLSIRAGFMRLTATTPLSVSDIDVFMNQ